MLDHLFNQPNLVDRADAVAEHFHFGQTRNDKVTPYITHSRAVAALFKNPLEKQVALLHDILEDTVATVELLRMFGFSEEVITAVVSMTKIEGESYEDYLIRVKPNVLATAVKIKDMLVNLSDEPSKNQVKKYAKGLTFLLT